jgi:hypothetical protein
MLQTFMKYKFKIDNIFEEEDLQKGLFIAVLHATRIPPHIGLIADKTYHSLSIKGQDLNTPIAALIKNTNIRKIPTLFIKIKSHPTFSAVYLREHFITNIQQFNRVDVGVATCLSPIKLFFEEVYGVSMKDVNYLYELLPLLEREGLITSICSLHLDAENYQLPMYTFNEINAGITLVRNELKEKNG